MKELIEFVARALAAQPERVEVRVVEPHRLELLVDRGDLGRVIGRKGRTAQAMRVLLRAMSAGSREPELEIAAHGGAAAE
jgi:hypothetical protein